MKVLAFGEILWDIIEGKKHLGGAPLNFTAHSVKCGNQSSLISAVGDDQLGTLALNQAIILGVDVNCVSTLNGIPTGTVDVFLNNGQPDYEIHDGVAFDAIPKPDLELLKAKEFDVFYFGTLAQRQSESRESLAYILKRLKFKHVFYDVNLRKNYYSKEIVSFGLKHCSVFKINDVESILISKLLYDSFSDLKTFATRIVSDYELDLIIITAAEKGCFVFNGTTFTHVEGKSIKVVDAVGAGDSFSAAFMHSYFKDQDEIKAATIANSIGAFVAGSRGAIPPYTSEILSILK